MNYKNIKTYLLFAAAYTLMWHGINYYNIGLFDGYDLFEMLVGTHSGYSYFLTIALVFVFSCLILADKQINPFSINRLSRQKRSSVSRYMALTGIKCAAIHTAIYAGVQILCTYIYVDNDIMSEKGFMKVMPLYALSLFTIFTVSIMFYLVLYVFTGISYLAIFITVAVNIGIAYFVRGDFLYGGITVLDYMAMGEPVNITVFLIYQMINICIAAVLYVIFQEIYKRKDIL